MDYRDLQNPFLNTRTSHTKRDISRNLRIVCKISNAWGKTHSRKTHRFCFEQGASDTEGRDEEYTGGVIVVIIN